MEKVLSGVRVLDFTDRLAGPYCTRYLADCGCEVINVEQPGGANCRTMPYLFDGQINDYMHNHCGKKSIVIDLKKDGAIDVVMELAKIPDVVVENFRSGVMKPMGVDYQALKQVNPSSIMCSISGWGQSGPYAELMGADITTQAYSGILDLTGPPNRRPCSVGIPIADILAGVNVFGAICAALYRRARTGEGDYIDIALVDCVFAALRNEVDVHVLTRGKERLKRHGSFHSSLSPYGIYKGRDDNVSKIYDSPSALIGFHRIRMRCTYSERKSSLLKLGRRVKILLRAAPSRDDGGSIGRLHSHGLTTGRMSRGKEKFKLVVDLGFSLDDFPAHPFKQFLKIPGQPWLRKYEVPGFSSNAFLITGQPLI